MDMIVKRIARKAAAFAAGIVLLGAGAAQVLAADNAQALAVVIGNQNYRGDVPDVAYARNDAAAIKEFLIDVLGYREANIEVLIDATFGEMIDWFGTEADPRGRLAARVVPGVSDVHVYYSGHGVPGDLVAGLRRGYLLPVDGNPIRADATGFSIDVLEENLAAIGARTVTIYLDACFTGTSQGGPLMPNIRATFTVAFREPSSVTVMSAAQGDQIARWDAEAGQGLFTEYLLRGLRGEADAGPFGNGDGEVTAEETKRFLDSEMTYRARQLFGRDQNATLRAVNPGVVLAALPPAPPVPVGPAVVEAMDVELYATGRVNVRSGVSAETDRLLTLDPGAGVTVTARVRGDGGDWFRVALADGRIGFVLGTLLEARAPPPLPPAGPDPALELAFWEAIQGSRDPADFDAYLEQYPNGTFAALARIRLDQIRQAEAPQQQAALPPAPAAAAPPQVRAPDNPPLGRNPGDVFRDCSECPEMVVVPAGKFRMGSPPGEAGRDDDEGPQHSVTIARPFAVGKFEVTRTEFAAFVNDTGHGVAGSCWYWNGQQGQVDSAKSWRDPGFRQTDRDPVACVSWDDAQAYIRWLNGRVSRQVAGAAAGAGAEPYRLLSEAEWEYAARAGTTAARYWGEEADLACGFANVNDRTGARVNDFPWARHECDDGYGQTAPVGSFRANAFGLHDMLGNVWEWTEDCWHDTYAGPPGDGAAWVSGGDCGRRVLRGGSWKFIPEIVRSANRFRGTSVDRVSNVGFRVARTL